MSNQLQAIVDSRTGGYSAADELANAEKVAKMYADAINTQYAAGIQNLTTQKANLSSEYDPYRAAANAQYERNVRTNNEQMANLGLTRSGTNMTNQVKLSTERQRNLAEVDTNQAKAAQELQAQINEYIAQRDSEIASQRASTYQSAYNNISDYQRSSALAEQQFGYDQKLAELDYAHDKEMAAINHEYAIAEMNNDYAKKAQLEREMAALEYSYSMKKIERQAELDNESYAQKAATDWNYYQQQAALDSQIGMSEYNQKAATDWSYYQQQAALDYQNDLSLYNSKAATDWSYYQKQSALDNSYSSSSSNNGNNGTTYTYSDMSDNAMALYSKYSTTLNRARASSNTQVKRSTEAMVFNAIGDAMNNNEISENDADRLIRLWGFN